MPFHQKASIGSDEGGEGEVMEGAVGDDVEMVPALQPSSPRQGLHEDAVEPLQGGPPELRLHRVPSASHDAPEETHEIIHHLPR